MEELDLKDLFNLFLSKIFQIILIVIIAAGIGIIYTMGFTTPKYSSSTTLVLTGSNENTSENSITTTDITLNSKLVSTYSVVVTSKSVLDQVIQNLNIDIEYETLKRNISVSAVEDAEIISITVTNEDSTTAARIANETADVFCDRVTEIYGMDNIHILDTAEVATEPSNINHTRDVVIFTLAGIVIAVLYVLIANMLDTTIKTPEDVEKGFGLPVLVSIPLIENFNAEKGGKKK